MYKDNYFIRLVLVSISIFFIFITAAQADVFEYGGEDQKFKGNGDLVPPFCQIDLPHAASSPFSIKWYCSDNDKQIDLIRTELWMYRKDQAAGKLIANFLGFPAAAYVDQNLLEVTNFSDGLPVHFRLLARDRAGVAMSTPFLTVFARDTSLTTCSLTVITEEKKSTGNTTGFPSMTTKLENANVTTTQNSNDDFQLSTSERTIADPCEIETICSDSNKITFSNNVSLKTQNVASATLTILPGNVNVILNGTFASNETELSSLNLAGETFISGVKAEVTINCSQ